MLFFEQYLSQPRDYELGAESSERSGKTARYHQKRVIGEQPGRLQQEHRHEYLSGVMKHSAEYACQPDMLFVDYAAQQQHSRQAEQAACGAV